MKKSWFFPIYISGQEFENLMNLLLFIDENKLHYVHIREFNRFMFHNAKNKRKKYFCKSCLLRFSCKHVLTEHKEVCLSINNGKTVGLEKETIGFEIISKKHQFHLKFMFIFSVF